MPHRPIPRELQVTTGRRPGSGDSATLVIKEIRGGACSARHFGPPGGGSSEPTSLASISCANPLEHMQRGHGLQKGALRTGLAGSPPPGSRGGEELLAVQTVGSHREVSPAASAPHRVAGRRLRHQCKLMQSWAVLCISGQSGVSYLLNSLSFLGPCEESPFPLASPGLGRPLVSVRRGEAGLLNFGQHGLDLGQGSKFRLPELDHVQGRGPVASSLVSSSIRLLIAVPSLFWYSFLLGFWPSQMRRNPVRGGNVVLGQSSPQIPIRSF